MRVGIMIKEFNALDNWELRVIQGLLEIEGLDIALLIKDGRPGTNTGHHRARRILGKRLDFGRSAFLLQERIERWGLPGRPRIDRETIFRMLEAVPTIACEPATRGFWDVFSREDADRVKAFDLDVILRHEFNIVQGEILNAARHGVWSIHHGDNTVNRGGPAGFWEVVLGLPVVGVTLLQITAELDGGLVIDRAYFDQDWSYVRNNERALEGSVALLLKNITLLDNRPFWPSVSPTYDRPLYTVPTMAGMLRYWKVFFVRSAGTLCRSLSLRLDMVRESWDLYVGQGDMLTATLFRSKPAARPRGESWSQPSFFEHLGTRYVFFIGSRGASVSGEVRCGRLSDRAIVDVVMLPDIGPTASLPVVVEEDGEVFLLVYQKSRAALEIYRCLDYPSAWQLHASAFAGESLTGLGYYEDDDGLRWLFVNRVVDSYGNFGVSLAIYSIDSLSLNKVVPHRDNPVSLDCRSAGIAGPVFSKGGKLYRPFRSACGAFNSGEMGIAKIEVLNLKEYKEEVLFTIEPRFRKGLVSIQHVDQADGAFVIDGLSSARFRAP